MWTIKWTVNGVVRKLSFTNHGMLQQRVDDLIKVHGASLEYKVKWKIL